MSSLCCLYPRPRRKRALVGADHVAVNRRGAQRSMAKPPLDQMRRNVLLKGIDAESMPQALRHGRRAGDTGRRHDGLDVAPRRRTAPAPEAQRRELRIPLRDPQLKTRSS